VLISACATQRVATPRVTPPQAAPAEIAPQNPQQERAATFVDRAISMLGQPYRYGGAGPGGFDCSGLVFYAARDAGALLPRTAREMLLVGEAVPREQLRPGDLVFMHLAAKELHVGIAIDNGRFVHAPSSGGFVRIDSLDRSPYSRGFLAARRISFPP
jgi:cell wall-associated NlpC family hydrolase